MPNIDVCVFVNVCICLQSTGHLPGLLTRKFVYKQILLYISSQRRRRWNQYKFVEPGCLEELASDSISVYSKKVTDTDAVVATAIIEHIGTF